MRVGRTAIVPYFRPGDPAVADAIRGAGRKIQRRSPRQSRAGRRRAGISESAIYATEELEETAKLYLLLRGMNPRILSSRPGRRTRRPFQSRSLDRRGACDGSCLALSDASPRGSSAMRRFSANLGFLFTHLPLTERIEAAAAAGFTRASRCIGLTMSRRTTSRRRSRAAT